MTAMQFVRVVTTNMETAFHLLFVLDFGQEILQGAVNICIAWIYSNFLILCKSLFPELPSQDLYTHWNTYHLAMAG